MSYWLGSIPILMFPIAGHAVPPPPFGFFLLTDFTNFLLTDNTPLLTTGA